MSNRKKGESQRIAAKQRKKENLKIEKETKKRNIKKNVIIILSIIIAISLAVSSGIILANIYVNSGAKMREVTYVESEHFKVSGATYSYFLYETYNAFREHYGSYVQTFGLDVNKSLKNQTFQIDEDGNVTDTWFDYFNREADIYLDEILDLCEEAYKNGIALNDEEIKACKEKSKAINPSDYGKGTNSNDIYEGMLLEMLASKYKGMVYKNIDVSNNEIDEYINENSQDYLYGYYREVKFSYTDSNYDKVVARIEKLKNAENDEQFVSLLIGFYTLDGEEEPEEKAENTYVKNIKNDIALDIEIVDMIFSGNIGEMKVIEGVDSFNVYYVIDKPSYDFSSTVTLRHILTNEASYGSVENARIWANMIYEMYENSDKTELSFANLATLYSAEQSSTYSGGLYSNIKKGELISDMNNWAFDESRKIGDVTIIENAYGFHILYYAGEGAKALIGDTEEILKEEKYKSILESFNYAIIYTKETLDKIYM